MAEPERMYAPGSPEAVESGCTCPQTDNHYGKGYRGIACTYIMDVDCPLHGFGSASGRVVKTERADG